MRIDLIVATALALGVIAAAWSERGWILQPLRARQRARERRGDSPDRFVQALSASGIEPMVARATYDELQRAMRASGVENFPVRASDDLAEVYRLSLREWDDADNLDLRYTVMQIVDRSNRSPPREGLESALHALGTVEDVARWIQSLPMIMPVMFIVEHQVRVTGHGNVVIGELREGRPTVGMHVQAGDEPASRFVINGVGSTSRAVPERTTLLLGPDQPFDEFKVRLPAGTVLREVSEI